MKPFVLIATRAEDEAADGEFEAFQRYSGLAERDLRRIRLEREPMPELDLERISGVIVGGSPFTTSIPAAQKSPVQVRVERELQVLLDRVLAQDVPFLGACYGIGTLGVHEGAVVDATHAEPVSAITVSLTAEAADDPLVRTAALPASFRAFVGHKEAVRELPAHATLLARGQAAPVQMFRVGRCCYATQFHPELDAEGIVRRIRVYRDAGYFAPEEMDELIARVSSERTEVATRLLRAFAELFSR